tara:strand:+ start:288 stop:467 length:180 start_codon:yes stop_codon:yes gene_type:complete
MNTNKKSESFIIEFKSPTVNNLKLDNKIKNKNKYDKKYNNKIKYNKNRNKYPIKDTYRK